MEIENIRARKCLGATGDAHDHKSDRDGDEARCRADNELKDGVGEPARKKGYERTKPQDEFDDWNVIRIRRHMTSNALAGPMAENPHWRL